MKVKLTAKFHPGREGEIVELSDKFAEALIADGKAEATTEKFKAKGKKEVEVEVEVEVEEPQAPQPTTEPITKGEEIVIE
jgi:hypothetical protein